MENQYPADLMDFSLQLQSPSASQIPLVCPRATQLAEQAVFPKVHLNPACAMPKVHKTRIMPVNCCMSDLTAYNLVTGNCWVCRAPNMIVIIGKPVMGAQHTVT